MRIVYIAAGAGMMYCGACARDLALIRELLARGHAVEVYPLYTPLRLDGGAPVPMRAVAFGGITVSLQQWSARFARQPECLRRWLDSPALLNFAAHFAIQTKPENLGPLTVSVLAGRDGRQAAELARLVDTIAAAGQPDAVMITNALLSGIAPALRARLDAPIYCTVQGEDLFVEGLRDPFRARAWAWMRAHAAAVTAYLAPGAAYAARMVERLGIPPEQMRVARPGVDLATYHPDAAPLPEAFTLAYLSVIIPGKGLDLLVDAVRRLREEGRDVRLRVAGKVLDPAYWARVRAAIRLAGLGEYVTWLGEVDLAGKLALLRGCSAFCQPSRAPEARGMAALEAMACAAPVIAPDAGIFPEVRALTGLGRLFTPGDPDHLAHACAAVMDDL
ncbi:MAG TPA: glycosyltransferase family 4 protein, partial [Armatimonadota bacterium]|nr:glycosyltransferase family 4 protein [Armatimonadota bacterium]